MEKTNSSMIGASHCSLSSEAIFAYSSLYTVWIPLAWSNGARGNGDGNNVTGACVARTLSSGRCAVGGGRTARPCASDQSVKLVRRYSSFGTVSAGGYSQSMEVNVIATVSQLSRLLVSIDGSGCDIQAIVNIYVGTRHTGIIASCQA